LNGPGKPAIFGSTAYVGTFDGVVQVPITGGVATTLSTTGTVRAAAADGTAVYAVNPSYLWKFPLDGGALSTLVSNTSALFDSVVVDGTNAYVAGQGYAMKVGLNGGTPVTLASGSSVVGSIAIGASSVYWLGWNGSTSTVMGVAVDGGVPVSVASGDQGVAADSTNVYSTSRGCPSDGGSCAGTVVKFPLAGGTPVTLASAQDGPHWLTTDATNVYWTNADQLTGAIVKVAISGGAPVTLDVAEPPPGFVSVNPRGIAVDSTSVYWTNLDVVSQAYGGSLMKLTPK
jgi:hypothetical protein